MSDRAVASSWPARRLTPELIPSAAELLAEAFATNPAHVYSCPDPETRFERLVWMLGSNLRLQPDLHDSFCLVRGAVVQAMGFWTKSGSASIGVLPKIRAGLLAAPLRLGIEGVRRLGEATRAIERQRARAVGDRPFWYLNNMAVRGHLRGLGIGTRLLGEQLGLVGVQAPAAAAVLATQRPENVSFYRRLGFEAASEEWIGQGPERFRNWIMLRPAPAPPAADAP